MTEFTHLDESGDARMVDVAAKDITDRRAVAEAFVRVSAEVVCVACEVVGCRRGMPWLSHE